MDEHMNRARFFGLLCGLPSGDLTQIQIAYWLAKNAHRPQAPRDSGERYFEHPRRVAVTLIERGVRDKDTITTALLHDVVEDTNTPLQIIVDLFPHVIWEQLYLLSKYVPIFDPLTGQIHDRTSKPTELYYAGIAAAKEPVRLVKLADRLDNLRSMGAAWDLERQRRYAADTREHLVPIAEKTDPWFHRELSARIASVGP